MTEDPTRRLSALREWQILFAAGRRYDRETLDGWLDDYRRYFAGWFQRNVIGTAAALAVDLFSHE